MQITLFHFLSKASLLHNRAHRPDVVFFVLESVAAQYTGPYGAAYGATPFLDSALDAR